MSNNYAALQAAIAARDYANESLVAEQKKFGYGASTPTLVLQASSNLTTAESNVLNAAANYEKSKVELDRVTAETLTKLGIDIADAESGKVKQMPKIQGVVPASNQVQRRHSSRREAGKMPSWKRGGIFFTSAAKAARTLACLNAGLKACSTRARPVAATEETATTVLEGL